MVPRPPVTDITPLKPLIARVFYEVTWIRNAVAAIQLVVNQEKHDCKNASDDNPSRYEARLN